MANDNRLNREEDDQQGNQQGNRSGQQSGQQSGNQQKQNPGSSSQYDQDQQKDRKSA